MKKYNCKQIIQFKQFKQIQSDIDKLFIEKENNYLYIS